MAVAGRQWGWGSLQRALDWADRGLEADGDNVVDAPVERRLTACLP